MRCTRPVTGADKVYTSCTRVSPSSSSVTTSGPGITSTRSTITALGMKLMASPMAMTPATAAQMTIRLAFAVTIYSRVFRTSMRSR